MPTQEAKTLLQQVMELISSEVDIPVERIPLDSEFETDLGFDSLALVEFIMAVEEQFDITIPDETTERIKTVQQAVDEIEQAIACKGCSQLGQCPAYR